MSIKESILQNTNLNAEKASNFRGGSAISPLDSEILSKSTKTGMFSKVAFDYLSFTFPYSKLNEDNFIFLRDLLLLKDQECSNSFGGNNYMASLKWNNQISSNKETFTKFFYQGNESTRNKNDEEVGFFDLSGDACRALEMRGGDRFPHYWYTILNALLFSVPHLSITRLDFAIDVFNSEISIEEINRQIRLGNFISPFICAGYQDNFNLKNYDVNLHILKVGSDQSDKYLEIYDKKEEREAIGKTVDFDSWYRFEFRFRRDQAKNFALNLLENWNLSDDSIGDFAARFLNKHLTLVSRPSQGKNALSESQRIEIPNDVKRKWKVNPAWEKMVGTSKRAVLVNYFKYESSITKNAEWFSSSVSVPFAKLFCANPDKFWVFVYKVLGDGVGRIKDKKEALGLINDYRKKKGDAPLNGRDLDRISETFKMELSNLVESRSDYSDIFDEDGTIGRY